VVDLILKNLYNMAGQEKIYKPKEQLTSVELEKLIFSDYGQHSALYVLANLSMVADGQWDEHEFFEKTNPNLIKNLDQYINRYCQTRNLRRPDKLSDSVIEKAEKIGQLVNELKEALTNKSGLKTIYKIVRRFESEAGIKMQKIKYYE